MNKILSVSQLNNYIKNVFEDELLLQNITVEGEIGEIKYSGGNTYFTIKENDCILPCVKFGARYEYDVGEKIRVTGGVRFYPRGGKITFNVTYVSRVGKGEALEKLNILKEKLRSEGIFDNNKTLPRFIKNIAIVTSMDGAVIHDFLKVLNDSACTYIDIDVYSVKVQGYDAPQSIVKALSLSASKNYDVLVVARGGGSEQDLSCFNAESVARGVFACPFPVISAIGHEVNFTLCDFASSLRAGTPSIAAEYIVRNNEAFLSGFYENLNKLGQFAQNLFGSRFSKAKRLLSDLSIGCERKASEIKAKINLSLSNLYSSCNNKSLVFKNELKSEAIKLQISAVNLLVERERELKYAAAVLDRSSPLKILSDGYAKVLKNGNNVNNVSGIDIGDKLKIVMSGGTLGVTVNEKE